MWRRFFLLLIPGVWLCLVPFNVAGQQSSRRPTPLPPRPTGDVFDRLERERQRQEREAARRKRQQERAERLERREALRQLREDLPQLRSLLDQIQAELFATEVRTELNITLRQHANELEKLAKRTRKNIRKL